MYIFLGIVLSVLIISVLLSSLVKKKYVPDPPLPFTHDLSSTSCIILWDIHGVLFKKSIVQWIHIVVTYPRLFSLITHLDKKTMILIGKYLLKKCALLNEEVTNQELLNCAYAKGNDALIDLTMRVSCAYTPYIETIAVLKKFHASGYTQHIGSNIGKKVFDQFAPTHKDIFDYFTAYHIIDTEEMSTVQKKPNREFFLRYLTKHNLKPEQVIFIDDRITNIVAAQTCGMIALHFKNPILLDRELQRLGLFKKKTQMLE